VQTQDSNFIFRLCSGDPAAQRAALRLMQASAIALLVLHVSVAASVMPYVYVDDAMANCGARKVLHQFGYDVLSIILVLGAASAFIALYPEVLSWLLRKSAFETGQRIFPRFALIGALWIGLSFVAYGYMTLSDLTFLSTPPVIQRYSAACPEVHWGSDAAKLLVGIASPRSAIDLHDPASEFIQGEVWSPLGRPLRTRAKPIGRRIISRHAQAFPRRG
jgi:hypothetical protein